jgi:hypothetical protein
MERCGRIELTASRSPWGRMNSLRPCILDAAGEVVLFVAYLVACVRRSFV